MFLYNTLYGKLEEFIPIDPSNIRMYICGPTVYDRAHIGNARPAVVFDVLYRLLRLQYPKVTYVRNITDVDDKIYKASMERNTDIKSLTLEMSEKYHQDLKALHVLSPDIEPKATEHINDMISFIQDIIANGYAYVSNGHVYFDISKSQDYGKLSHKKLADLIEGARVEVSTLKRHPGDFVLWKPCDINFPIGWDSPWGKGRPGWHIECSTMAAKYFGETFDIHGGGSDLIFPHHENEIAQSKARHHQLMAKYWLHNGHLMVNGQKMSKSLGNFVTIHDLLTEFDGETIRLALMMTHYRSPLNFSRAGLLQARNTLNHWYSAIKEHQPPKGRIDQDVLTCLHNDLNIPAALTHISALVSDIKRGNSELVSSLVTTCQELFGLLHTAPEDWFKVEKIDETWVQKKIEERALAKRNHNFALADAIRAELQEMGIVLEDTKSKTIWRKF